MATNFPFSGRPFAIHNELKPVNLPISKQFFAPEILTIISKNASEAFPVLYEQFRY